MSRDSNHLVIPEFERRWSRYAKPVHPSWTIDETAVLVRGGIVVGEYFDEADITSASSSATYGYGEFDARPYDLQRVAVLRGPQGTLFGVGAMGGVIRFITNRPVLDHLQMSADMSSSFTQSGAPGQRIEAMVNAPIIANVLGLRIAGETEHGGGWINEPAANLRNINGNDLTDVRIQGRWQPISALNVYATQTIHRNSYGLSNNEDANGNYIQLFNSALVPNGRESFDLSNLTLIYDFGSFELVNSATYYNREVQAKNWGYPCAFCSGSIEFMEAA